MESAALSRSSPTKRTAKGECRRWYSTEDDVERLEGGQQRIGQVQRSYDSWRTRWRATLANMYLDFMCTSLVKRKCYVSSSQTLELCFNEDLVYLATYTSRSSRRRELKR